MTSLAYSLYNYYVTGCSSTTEVVDDPDTLYIPNEFATSIDIQTEKSYAIRIIKKGYDSNFPAANLKGKYNRPFIFMINGSTNINSLQNLTIKSYISNIDTYSLNNDKTSYNLNPIQSTNMYKSITLQPTSLQSPELSNETCSLGDYISAFDSATPALTDAISIRCSDNRIISTGLTSDSYRISNGFVLRVYPKEFFNNLSDYISNPANQLVYQEDGITNFSTFATAIGNFAATITSSQSLDDFMYEWTAVMTSTANQKPSIIFKSIDTPANFYYNSTDGANPINNQPTITEIGNGRLEQVKKNSHCIQKYGIVLPETNVSPTTYGSYIVYKFTTRTGINTIKFNGRIKCDVLLVGGGGAGGGDIGGGGGGGEVVFRENIIFKKGSTYNIVVGAGGRGSSNTATGTYNKNKGEDGKPSYIYKTSNDRVYQRLFANGGGGGGCATKIGGAINGNAGNGNAGGGGGSVYGDTTLNISNGGAGINNGNNGIITNNYLQGGGGGGAGGAANGNIGGPPKLYNTEDGITEIEYGAGGGGGCKGIVINNNKNSGGTSQTGGNGSYSICISNNCPTQQRIVPSTIILTFKGSKQDITKNGIPNTGSGGGGGGFNDYPNINNGGGNGSDGVIIIRFLSTGSIGDNDITVEDFNVATTTVYESKVSSKQYPPPPTSGSYNWGPWDAINTLTINSTNSSADYGYGTYVVSCPGVSAVGTGNIGPGQFFNYNMTDAHPALCYLTWKDSSGNNLYNATTGAYTNSSDSGYPHYLVSDYNGEWIKIRMPVAIVLTSYNIYAYQESRERAPQKWRIYGSNDGTIWNVIDSQDYSTSKYSYADNNNKYSSLDYSLSNQTSVAYSYFAIVINACGAVGANSGINFIELQLFGFEKFQSSNTQITNNIISGTNDYFMAFTSGENSIKINNDITCDILVVGGGGGGAACGNGVGGGGGGGGVINIIGAKIKSGTYYMKVGTGGLGGKRRSDTNVQDCTLSANGLNSIAFASSTSFNDGAIAYGGGAGSTGVYNNIVVIGVNGKNGGCGGGGSISDPEKTGGAPGGIATQGTINIKDAFIPAPNTNPLNGKNGGRGSAYISGRIGGGSGGGGGASLDGGDGIYNGNGGDGGEGFLSAITGVQYYFGGGGGGGTWCSYNKSNGGNGGKGGGGGGATALWGNDPINRGIGGRGGFSGGSKNINGVHFVNGTYAVVPDNSAYSYITFTENHGNIKFERPTVCDILVVGGGGSGATRGGGGGAGALIYIQNITFPANHYKVCAGKGGANDFGISNGGRTNDGEDSYISFKNNGAREDFIRAKGGGGAYANAGISTSGSGSDDKNFISSTVQSYGFNRTTHFLKGSCAGIMTYKATGNILQYFTTQQNVIPTGFNVDNVLKVNIAGKYKGNRSDGTCSYGGYDSCFGTSGGGGAGGPGGDSVLDSGNNNATGGNGGPGFMCRITGIDTYYAAGGGGGTTNTSTGSNGIGGIGGGGNGSKSFNRASDGATGTGSGGGGGGWNNGGDSAKTDAQRASDMTALGGISGAGGSGIIIIRFANGNKTLSRPLLNIGNGNKGSSGTWLWGKNYNLVAWYKFDDSTNIGLDSSDNKLNLTNIGSVSSTADGRRGTNAITFTNSNYLKYFDGSNRFNPSSFTCCCWVKCKYVDGWQMIFGTRKVVSGTNNGWGLFIWPSAGHLYFQNANNNNGNNLGITNQVITNSFAWYHIAVTFISGRQEIYVNGVKQSISGGYDTTPIANTNNFTIGTFIDFTYSHPMTSGSIIDELLFYGYVLTSQEIKNIYDGIYSIDATDASIGNGSGGNAGINSGGGGGGATYAGEGGNGADGIIIVKVYNDISTEGFANPGDFSITAYSNLITKMIDNHNYNIYSFYTGRIFQFTITNPITCDILLVGGGGSGGVRQGGGGGAGAVIYLLNQTLTAGSYSIYAGGGGAGHGAGTLYEYNDFQYLGRNGENSYIMKDNVEIYRAIGGGGGGYAITHGKSGGSCGGNGGGHTDNFQAILEEPSNANIPPIIYGNKGGAGNAGNRSNEWCWVGGGGGGAGTQGRNAIIKSNIGTAGDGGNGINCDITGYTVYYGAGGGGGCAWSARNEGTGGLGGGGRGGVGTNPGTAGEPNTGSGGGGGGFQGGSNGGTGSGGSGIVILKII